MSATPTNPSRRTVAKGAAWTVPVVATALAAPAASASTAGQDVVVSSSCYGLTILGVGASFPQFTITAVGAPIEAGSTFTLTGSGLANLTLGGPTGFFDFKLLNGGAMQITLNQTIPAGGSQTVRVTGIISKQVLKTYTLSATNIIGNANSVKSNDTASANLTGVSVLGLIVGYCGTQAAVAAAHQSNLQKVAQMSPEQRAKISAAAAK
ncbi:hypothetical protein [Flexivirga meconopsidis]|uniref:hypothetical protein n=1 Tax=Flexivirga meconopsidis TaxID=2977121 RepID=UPI00223E9186|nr:hypothetical protein [Flexivirga meconopsidis]